MTSVFPLALGLRLRLHRASFEGDFLYPGINYPWNAYGADFGTGGFGDLNNLTQFTSHMTALAAQRVKVVRWWLMADGRYCPTFDGSGAVTGLNTDFLTDLDAVLALATTLDIKYVMTLIDQTMFNVASFSGSVQLGGHEDIVKNSTRRQLYLDLALKPILEHVAASPHADRVLMWDICNEPEAQIAGGYNGFDFYTGPAQFALSDMQDFVHINAQYIHAYGGIHAKATVGAAIPVWCPLWIGLGLDFHQAHYYDFMDLSGPGSGLTPVSDITKDDGITHLDAPCFLGEFPTAGLTSYGLSDTAVKSARWYLDTIRSRGYIGSLGWSLTAGDSASDWTSFAPVYTDWMNDNYPTPASVAFQAGASQGGGGPYSIALTVASAVGKERLVALSGIANGTGATVTLSSVTIDGQAATQVGSYARSSDTASVLSLWRAPGTSGTSINVTATASAAMFDLRCLLWTLTNVGTLLASTNIGLATTTTTQSLSVNTVANGVVIAATLAFDSGTVSATWTGLTERFDGISLYSGDCTGGADTAITAASTPLAISVTWSYAGSFNVAGIAASFNPSHQGFPDALTTGPQAGTSFTTTSGEINTSSDGQVIQNLDLTGYILVRHNNVTIQDCIITGSSGDITSIIPVVAALTNLTIRRCRIVGFQGISCIAIESVSTVEVAHCDLSNTENGITIAANNVDIHDCYIHNLEKGGDPHFDGIQGFPGPYTNWTINHNTINARDTSGFITSGTSGSPNSGLTVTNNLFLHNFEISYGMQIQHTTGVTITNNRISIDNFGAGPETQRPVFPIDLVNCPTPTVVGNVHHETGAPITPSIS